ncbi:hypothetical protein EAG_10076 [Camponotus floridanus]|uniref:Uncharacterized protein n=1 Tax=Camponotus floridanus TaxID=104421 RepID=E2ATZ7_CAMFO|nr:hypothetical protein EAG_10076 [Camponotus floridanus]
MSPPGTCHGPINARKLGKKAYRKRRKLSAGANSISTAYVKLRNDFKLHNSETCRKWKMYTILRNYRSVRVKRQRSVHYTLQSRLKGISPTSHRWKSLNNIVRFTAGYAWENPMRDGRNGAHRSIAKSRLKSAGAESVVVDKFPLRRGAAFPETLAFSRNCSAGSSQSISGQRSRGEHYVEPSPVVEVDAPAVASPAEQYYRENCSVPANALLYVSKLLVVALRSRNPSPIRTLSPPPQRASPDREQPPSPLFSRVNIRANWQENGGEISACGKNLTDDDKKVFLAHGYAIVCSPLTREIADISSTGINDDVPKITALHCGYSVNKRATIKTNGIPSGKFKFLARELNYFQFVFERKLLKSVYSNRGSRALSSFNYNQTRLNDHDSILISSCKVGTVADCIPKQVITFKLNAVLWFSANVECNGRIMQTQESVSCDNNDQRRSTIRISLHRSLRNVSGILSRNVGSRPPLLTQTHNFPADRTRRYSNTVTGDSQHRIYPFIRITKSDARVVVSGDNRGSFREIRPSRTNR